MKDLRACSFCRYKGLGLAHKAFDRSNALLALSGILKFSAKNITLMRGPNKKIKVSQADGLDFFVDFVSKTVSKNQFEPAPF